MYPIDEVEFLNSAQVANTRDQGEGFGSHSNLDPNLLISSFSSHMKQFARPSFPFYTNTLLNKLGLSCAKLNTRLASYAKWANQSWSQ